MDQSRYEEVPQKENPFKKGAKSFGRWIKFVIVDFINSFKYNNMKLPGLLILIPGAIFGFSLDAHAKTIRDINLSVTGGGTYNDMFDYSGLVLFALMLVCILNIFAGFSLMNKKNKGSVIICMLSTILIIGFGVAYIYLLMIYHKSGNEFYDAIDSYYKSHPDVAGADEEEKINTIRGIISNKESEFYIYAITASKRPVMNDKWFLSVGTVVFCALSSIAGVVLGFIKYDRTYEKSRDR